jgi:hypothetical protein
MAVKVFLRGGLGNQLFQYAAGLFLAKKQNEEVVLRSDLLPKYSDTIASTSRWPIQITDFEFEGLIISKSNQPPNATNTFSKIMQAQRFLGDTFGSLMIRAGVLSGDLDKNIDFLKLPKIRAVNYYCVSSKPALELNETLRRQLFRVVNPSKKFLELLTECHRNRPIVVHVRLGDYRNATHLYGEPNFDRLEQVISRAILSKESPVWLFTDSPEEFNSKLLMKLKVDKVVAPAEIPSSIENLILLSAGSKLICSNSTFSWWAAFLKGPGGDVHYPRFTEIVNEVFKEDMVLWAWEPY